MAKRAKKEELPETPEPPEPVTPEDFGGEDFPAPAPEGDGPTHVDPIPPPVVPEVEKPRRGRPKGSKNKTTERTTVKPIIGVETVKRELVQGSAMIAGFARGSKWQKITDAAALHEIVKVRDESGNMTDVIASTQRCDIAIGLMAPYMEKSGMLSAAQLSDEGKFAIGVCILAGPPIIAGFGMLLEWALHPKKREPARTQTVPIGGMAVVPPAPLEPEPEAKTA